MSLIDDVIDKAKAGVAGQAGASSGLLSHVLSLVNSDKVGGLSGLVQLFREKGLDQEISSWISTGKNLPISAEQIQQVLGNAHIQEMAQKVGLSTQDVSSHLAQLLPSVIDRLTPNGSLPANNMLEQGISLLKSKLLG